jgi:beta-glucanase (GH16 family)
VKPLVITRPTAVALVLAGLLIGSLPALAAPGASQASTGSKTTVQRHGASARAPRRSVLSHRGKATSHPRRVTATHPRRVTAVGQRLPTVAKPAVKPTKTTTLKTATAAQPATTPTPTATSATETPLSGGLMGTGSSPSGTAMPVGDTPGWNQVFADDFNGPTLNTNLWRLYWGQPGGDPGGWFDPNHVSVSNGMLIVSAYQDPADGGKWASGGISSSPGLVQTYGKYLVRFRFDAGAGVAHAILLWPADNSWPPEIDFSEDNGANRQTTYATLHYGANNTQVQDHATVDLTKWHTLGVQWTPGRLVYTLDGKAWATVNNAQVPATPMTMDIQTQAWACGTSTWEQCSNASTPSHVNLYVDWAVAYSMS